MTRSATRPSGLRASSSDVFWGGSGGASWALKGLRVPRAEAEQP